MGDISVIIEGDDINGLLTRCIPLCTAPDV